MIRLAVLLESISARIGLAVAWLGIPLMVLLAAMEPIGRWLGLGDARFGDASTAVFLAVIMTAFGYAYVAGAHVRLDMLSRRFPERVRAALELVGTLVILVPLCALVVIGGAESAWRAFQLGERWAESAWPLQWALKAWVPFGFLLLMLAALAAALRALLAMFRR